MFFGNKFRCSWGEGYDDAGSSGSGYPVEGEYDAVGAMGVAEEQLARGNETNSSKAKIKSKDFLFIVLT